MALTALLTAAQIERIDRNCHAYRAMGLGTLLNQVSQVTSGLGASMIGVEDSGGNFTGTDVESVLAELVGAGGTQVDLIFAAATELTIATGAVAATQAAHTIDTESDGASDDLDDITGGTAEEVIWLRPANAARTVVLKHAIGADKIACPGGVDISLAEATDWACLAYDGTQWIVQSYNTLARPTTLDQIFTAATELTIATGVIAATQAAHTVDTEADAASDTLDDITGGTAEELLVLRPANAARTVILAHAIGADKIACPGGSNILLQEVTDFALLYYNGTQWIVLDHSTLAVGNSVVKEVTMTITTTDLTASATTQEIAITSPPANCIIVGGFIELETDFSGGSVSALTASIGDTAAPTEVAVAVDVFTGAGAGLKDGEPGVITGLGFKVAYVPVVKFTSTTDNVDNLTAGSLIAHLRYIPCAAETA